MYKIALVLSIYSLTASAAEPEEVTINILASPVTNGTLRYTMPPRKVTVQVSPNASLRDVETATKKQLKLADGKFYRVIPAILLNNKLRIKNLVYDRENLERGLYLELCASKEIN